ncbi:hypothetical protein ACI65C_009199 [Semiaphis heraclei]
MVIFNRRDCSDSIAAEGLRPEHRRFQTEDVTTVPSVQFTQNRRHRFQDFEQLVSRAYYFDILNESYLHGFRSGGIVEFSSHGSS